MDYRSGTINCKDRDIVLESPELIPTEVGRRVSKFISKIEDRVERMQRIASRASNEMAETYMWVIDMLDECKLRLTEIKTGKDEEENRALTTGILADLTGMYDDILSERYKNREKNFKKFGMFIHNVEEIVDLTMRFLLNGLERIIRRDN